MNKISGRLGMRVDNELVLDAGSCEEKLLARKSQRG
jgi:hypothetical protein